MRGDNDVVLVEVSGAPGPPLGRSTAVGAGRPRVAERGTPKRRVAIAVAAVIVLATITAVGFLARPAQQVAGVMPPIAHRPSLVVSLPYEHLGLETTTTAGDAQPLVTGSMVGVRYTRSETTAGGAGVTGTLVVDKDGRRWYASGYSIALADPARTDTWWSADLDLGASAVEVVAGTAVIFTWDQGQLHLSSRDLATGEQRYEKTFEANRLVSLGQGAGLVLMEVSMLDNSCQVAGLRPTDGSVVWQQDLGAGCSSLGIVTPMRTQGDLAAVERPRQTVLNARTGAVVLSHARGLVMVLPTGLIGARTGEDGTEVYGPDGTLRYTIDALAAAFPTWGLPGDTFAAWVGPGSQILAGYDAATGAQRWRVSAPGHVLGQVDSALVVLTPAGHVAAIDAASGNTVWDTPVRVGRDATMRVLATDRATVVIEERSFASREYVTSLHALDLRDGHQVWTHTFTGTPAVAADTGLGALIVTTNTAVQIWDITGTAAP